MTTIDVHDLPEYMAKAVAETVQTLRSQIKKKHNGTAPGKLVSWPLGTKGTLRREEIYDHLDQQR